MDIFVHQQNLLLLQRQLAETPDESHRQQLSKLLAEEAAKNPDTAQRQVSHVD